MRNRKRAHLGASLLAALGAVLVLALPASAAARDRNDDRIPDKWEKRHKLSLKVDQRKLDQDDDGLRNLGEYRSRTDPRDADSDDDGLEDSDEDRDGDDVDNYNEQKEHTKQNDRDSDGDHIADADEDADHDRLDNGGEDVSGHDPTDVDTDDDGKLDGDEVAGTVSSFDGSTLTIAMLNGTTLSGLVTSGTEISCESEDELESHHGSGNEIDDAENGDDDNLCSTAELVPGAPVHEAELEHGEFEEIELVK